MDVSGRTTQETKSSSYRGDKVEQLPVSCLPLSHFEHTE